MYVFRYRYRSKTKVWIEYVYDNELSTALQFLIPRVKFHSISRA